MTTEEFQRIKQYSDKLQAASGEVMVLAEDETLDLQRLLEKWMDETKIMHEKKEVTPERYAEVLNQRKDEVYHMAIQGWQMPILHELITLAAADHPGMKDLGRRTKELIDQVRWWCREKFKEWGFSPEEIEYLDKMGEDARGKITEECSSSGP